MEIKKCVRVCVWGGVLPKSYEALLILKCCLLSNSVTVQDIYTKLGSNIYRYQRSLLILKCCLLSNSVTVQDIYTKLGSNIYRYQRSAEKRSADYLSTFVRPFVIFSMKINSALCKIKPSKIFLPNLVQI